MEACDLKQYITDIECYGNTNLSKAENISLVIQRNHLNRNFYLGDTAIGCPGSKGCRPSPLSMLHMALEK